MSAICCDLHIELPIEDDPDIASPVVAQVTGEMILSNEKLRQQLAVKVGELLVAPEEREGVILEDPETVTSIAINPYTTTVSTIEGRFAIPTLRFWGMLIHSQSTED